MKERTDNQFSESQIRKISERFASYSQDGCMTIDQFKKSMGLLGVGQSQYLSNRIFSLITNCSYCTCEEFVGFLDTINNGSHLDKVRLSFHYLDRQRNKRITFEDIEVIINEISFVWNFLTGEKISTTDLTQIICVKLGISEEKSIDFQEYAQKYDKQFNWYDFFNNPVHPSRYQDQQSHYSSIRNSSNQFKIEQIEEYLKFVHEQIQQLLFAFREEQESEPHEIRQFSNGLTPSNRKGPKTVAVQQFQPRGDHGLSFRQTIPYLNQEQLARQLQKMHEQGNIYDVIANKLEQLSQISSKLFTNRMIAQEAKHIREKAVSRHQMEEGERKKTVKNITVPPKKRRNIIYFGHQNWNIMLNMMLGVRRSLKSHYYKFEQPIVFKEEDLTCKYYHELIYKKNDKSIKEISEIFVVYSPKVFFYIRQWSRIDNYQILKSIGLQNLIGNLLLGNLSTLSDQTSEGKSGSFMYYTNDSKIIVKSISRQQYVKLREIVENYAFYIKENPDSYLIRIYGLYKMKNKSSNRTIYFIIIGNVFDQQIDIDERYDIKGATHKRQILIEESQEVQSPNRDKNVALKDVDLMNNHSLIFNIDPVSKQKVFNQLIKDAEFLRDRNIIEYSLLIGIHYVSSHQQYIPNKQISLFSERTSNRQIVSQNKRQIYFFGVIDILSEYTTAKKFESGFFSILNYDISCKDPQQYYQRFKNFIFKYVFSM